MKKFNKSQRTSKSGMAGGSTDKLGGSHSQRDPPSGTSQPTPATLSSPGPSRAVVHHPTPATPTSAESPSSIVSATSGRRGRGPAKAYNVRTLAPGETLNVQLVGGSGVGPNGQEFTSYLGVCNRVHCNLWQRNYITLAENKKEAIFRDLEQHFTFERSTSIDVEILRHMGEMQRKQRNHLKKKYFTGRSLEEACELVPPQCDPEQWHHMCEIWVKDESKALSQKNKSNRAHLTMPYRRGRTNIHQLKIDFTQKEGRRPTRPEVFQMTQTYEEADGSIVWSNNESRAMMDNMRQLMNVPPSEESDAGTPEHPFSAEDAFLTVFGRDRPGRIRCGGRGQTRNTWYGVSDGGASTSTSPIVQELMKKVEKQSSLLHNQASQIKKQNSVIDSLQQKLNNQEKNFQDAMERLTQQMLAKIDQRLPPPVDPSSSMAPPGPREDEDGSDDGDGSDENEDKEGSFGDDE